MMKANERRKEMAMLLANAKAPVAGNTLSERFGVSRQIIVQDIATLREEGYEILSTHYGYLLQKVPLLERVFEVMHTADETEPELRCIVANGGSVKDVFVKHKVYGKISAPLNIYSNRHIDRFINGVKNGTSSELMNITGGRHFHTVLAESEEILDKVEQALKDGKYLISVK